MSEMSPHGEWLSLIDISGPFLAEPVLKDAFPQGLEGVDSGKRTMLRQAYDEWRDARDDDDDDFPDLHQAWIALVLRQGLELDEDGAGDILKSGDQLNSKLALEIPEHGLTLRPDFAVVDDRENDNPLMLVSTYNASVSLEELVHGDGWQASPAERMVELCRAAGTRLGLITNGEHWMFVDAPVGAVTTFASWYARLWSPEPKTLQSFVNLFGIRRFFVGTDEQLPALLDASLKLQDEVTDALGEQVRRAVEVLIQSLDRADVDRSRELLAGIEPAGLYEAGLTVMMRIVFLLSAEERGLLLLGDERYEAYYAVSTLRMQLRAESEEILERRFDAWSRLLAIFRAVYSGIEHDELRLPALGGSLFDPVRFPFLEGRTKRSHWRNDPAPLPIDNRTVLLLLDAVQLFQGRTLSYRALDVEQIGYVYEGLLERTVVRAAEVTLDLDATKNAKTPWVTLDELEEAAKENDEAVAALLKERTGSSASRVMNDLAKAVDDGDADKLLTSCHGDQELRRRVEPYYHLLRTDRWGYPLVYPVGTFMVTTGTDRRETGTHYTPQSLTEAIVKETLEPVVYIGPAEGKPRTEWALKGPGELLELKICDPAMGSGAFLVQVCRWLGEQLVKAWAEAEAIGQAVTADGLVVDALNGYEPLRVDPEERALTARRLIAERCLYGVDVNPLAVELAKLSIWLVTLAKGRPFGFLDHNLRSGDSLLGISEIDQLLCLDMEPKKSTTRKLFAADIDKAVNEAVELRAELRSKPIRDIRDVEAMARLDDEARSRLVLPELIADGLIAEVLSSRRRSVDTTSLSIEAGNAMAGKPEAAGLLRLRAAEGLSTDLESEQNPRRPFHWPLEFPEVFMRENGGFDAFVGNPPFLGGQRISGTFGASYANYAKAHLTLAERSIVDLVVYFFIRCDALLRKGGFAGLIARRSISEGKNRRAGLLPLIENHRTIYSAITNIAWQGTASVVVHLVHFTNADWKSEVTLNSNIVSNIDSSLSSLNLSGVEKLPENAGLMFQGTILNAEGFKVDLMNARDIQKADARYSEVLFPFVGGGEINTLPMPSRDTWVINFWDWPIEKAEEYPLALSVVEKNVKPERTRRKKDGTFQLRRPLPQKWWQHGEKRPAMYRALGRGHSFEDRSDDGTHGRNRLKRALVISRGVTKYPAFTLLENEYIFSEKLYVIADDRFSVFAVLTSDIHSIWAWANKTSLGGDLYSLSYTQGEIFETFPFPGSVSAINNDDSLSAIGREFFEIRQDYMNTRDQGLTKFYNDFHSPERENDEIKKLRKAQEKLNREVVSAYGISDIDLDMGFHQVEYLPEGSNTRFTINENARIHILRELAQVNITRQSSTYEVNSNKAKSKVPWREEHYTDDLFSDREGTG